MRRLSRVGAVLAVLLVVLGTGALGGALWVWLAEPAAYVVGDQGAVLSEAGAGQQVQVLIVYLVVGAVIGLVLGLLAGWRHDLLGWGWAPLLVVVTVAAAVVAWRLGTWWGPDEPTLATARAASQGDRLPLPLGIGSFAPVLAWPIGALVGLLVVTASVRERPRERSAPR